MKNRLIALALAAVLLLALAIPACADTITMYVYTENGKSLNVRDGMSTSAKVIGTIPFGGKVDTVSEHANHWMEILYKGQTAFVMSRFLVETKPAAKPTPKPTEKTDREKELEELNKQLRSLKPLADSVNLVVRPSRVSGWVNFRVGPGVAAARIASFSDGKVLQAIGETAKWYQAIDPETNRTGFISKNYVTVQPRLMGVTATNTSEQLGSLNVNGKFNLQCKMPQDYTLQVTNMMGTQINANLNPTMAGKPKLYLSINFDETYADVARLNDLSAEDLAVLEASFKEMNEVNISYTETSHGTKLLVARETGNDTDFVDILSIYEGYFIEFIMAPDENAADKTLTDAQVQMCVDFLSDLDFIPAT